MNSSIRCPFLIRGEEQIYLSFICIYTNDLLINTPSTFIVLKNEEE